VSELKLSVGWVLIIILFLVVAVTLSFFWVVLTPRWSFTVATNKAVYAIGEDVQITVTLKNMGYIPQSITSAVASPVIVWVDQESAQAWYAPYNVQIDQTTFTIASDQSLTRTFTWNQSWYNQVRYPGQYRVRAAIPNAGIVGISDVGDSSGRQFYAYTAINITST
jgi:hypothetical protein